MFQSHSNILIFNFIANQTTQSLQLIQTCKDTYVEFTFTGICDK